MRKMVHPFVTIVYTIWFAILIVIPFLPSLLYEDENKVKILTYLTIFTSIMTAFILYLNIYMAAVKAPFVSELTEHGANERFLFMKKLDFSWEEIEYIFIIDQPSKYICFAKKKIPLTKKRRLYLLALADDFILFPWSPDAEVFVRKHTDVQIHDETNWNGT